MRITTTNILLIVLVQLMPYILGDPQYPANKRINPCITIGANSYYQGDLSKPCATTTYYNDPQGGSCACCTPTASGVCETLPWAGVKRVAAASPLVFGINNADACPQCCATGCGKCFRVTFVDYGPTEHSTCVKSSVDKCQNSLSVMIVNSCFDAHTCPPIGQANPSGFFAHIDLLDMTGFVRQDYGWSNPVVYYERIPCNGTDGTPTDSDFGQCQATCQDRWGNNCAKSNPSWKPAVPAPPGISATSAPVSSATSAPAPAPPKTSATSAPVTSPSPSNGACIIAMSQTLSSSYSSGGQTVNQYTVVLKNNHATQSLKATVGFSSSPLSFWSLDPPSSARDLVYGLPDWLSSGIPAGATHEFGFTTPASAPVTVQIVTPCSSVPSSAPSSSPSPAPATPTPRAATTPPSTLPPATLSPATPSPATLPPATMPPATPSSTLPPSATPSSCSAISFSTRKMGSWTDETGNVVQYAVTITNTGPSALPSVIIDADAASRSNILSLYALTATGTSWTIPAYALPLSPASSLTFGYIGHNPLPLVFQATC